MFGISFSAEKPFAPEPIEKNSKIEPIAPIQRGKEEGERSDAERRENLEPYKGVFVDIEA